MADWRDVSEADEGPAGAACEVCGVFYGEHEADCPNLEPDAWVVADAVTGTFLRGPYGSKEQAERAREEFLTPDLYVAAPIYF